MPKPDPTHSATPDQEVVSLGLVMSVRYWKRISRSGGKGRLTGQGGSLQLRCCYLFRILLGLFQVLESEEFNKKMKMSTAKPTEFSCILKVIKQQLGTKPYQVIQASEQRILHGRTDFVSPSGHVIVCSVLCKHQ